MRGKASQARDPTRLLQGKYCLNLYQTRDPTTIGVLPIPGADDRLQQQILGGGISKPAQSLEAVGHHSEGDQKYGCNGTGPGSYVKGSGAVVAIIWHQELFGDWGYAQGPDSVPP